MITFKKRYKLKFHFSNHSHIGAQLLCVSIFCNVALIKGSQFIGWFLFCLPLLGGYVPVIEITFRRWIQH